MKKKIRWLKQPDGGGVYRVGNVEEVLDGGLADLWVSKGWAEYVDDPAVKTTAQEQAEDLARREKHVPAPSVDKAVHEAPVDRSVKSSKKR